MSHPGEAVAGSVARDLYELWRDRRLAGHARGFEDFVRQWPQHAAELRRLHAHSPGGGSWDGNSTPLPQAAAANPAPSEVAPPTAPEVPPRIAKAFGERFRVDGVLGSGGAGIVLRVQDRALHRELALKMLRREFEAGGPLQSADARSLRRLIDEAEVLGKLDHPSIVPVHELGEDDRGRVYFTMPRIEGRPLGDGMERLAAGDAEWSRERILEVLLKVCDALAYAHARGVLHRDLKPDNVMVGRFGQVYVVDWGLARDHEGGGEKASDDPAVTAVGDVLGTPYYMSPEQARADRHAIGPASDVYAIGAMLYETLALRPPYSEVGASSAAAVVRAVTGGPPTDVAELSPHAPDELVAIVRKAMAREVSARYASVAELAQDLRAFMEGRVVAAHEHGGWAQLRKWVLRNRALAGSLAALGLVSVCSAVWVARLEHASAITLREQADRRAFASLQNREAELWPARPEHVPAMLAWIDEANELHSRAPTYQAELDELRRTNAVPASGDRPREPALARLADEATMLRARIDGLEQDVANILARAEGIGREQGVEFSRREQSKLLRRLKHVEATLADRSAFEFTTPQARQRAAELERILNDARELALPIDGGIARMNERVRAVRDAEARSLRDGAAAWREVGAYLAGEEGQRRYLGLSVAPQFGLLPLGRDPHSGLLEFVDVTTGSSPHRAPDGALALEPDSGVVLVLVPPGDIELGHDCNLPVVPAFARARIDAFLIAKHELTQAQWTAMCGENPSYYRVGTDWPLEPGAAQTQRRVLTATWMCPVEQISWIDAQRELARRGLALPTEAQWEYACRAGTTTPWAFGARPEDLIGKVNSADRGEGALPFDGWHVPAPIATFPANAWGLHEMHGNLGEWTLEPFWTTFRFPLRDGDGRSQAPESRLRTVRGGNSAHGPNGIASGARAEVAPSFSERAIGVRPVRALKAAGT